MITALKRFVRDEQGATLAEYGLLLMLIAVAAIATMTTFGHSISNMYSNVSTDV